jgi:hypothetical protein
VRVDDPVEKLRTVLAPHGFHPIPLKAGSPCRTILKRQTFNTNRAVAVVEVASVPEDLAFLVKAIKKEAAFRCGFFPYFYGIGTQLVLITQNPVVQTDIYRFVDKFDNQWSIVQSIFVSLKTAASSVPAALGDNSSQESFKTP